MHDKIYDIEGSAEMYGLVRSEEGPTSGFKYLTIAVHA